jgi:hypothetical protein
MEPEHNLNYPYKREAGGGVVVETEEEKVTWQKADSWTRYTAGF